MAQPTRKIYNNEEKEKILNALKTIRQVCKETSDCEVCPFGDEAGHCFVSNGCGDNPVEWVLNDEKNIWRAMF